MACFPERPFLSSWVLNFLQRHNKKIIELQCTLGKTNHEPTEGLMPVGFPNNNLYLPSTQALRDTTPWK